MADRSAVAVGARPVRALDAVWSRPARALDAVVDSHGSVRAIGVMRALFGVIVIRHLWPDLAAERVPVERFHVPWWDWLPTPSPEGYRAIVWVGVAAGAAMVVGLASRLATATALVTVSYLLFVDMTGFAHNRAFLVWVLACLALMPTGRAVSIDALVARRWWPGSAAASGAGSLWPVHLLRIVVASVYLTSATTKLVNPDWRSGLVLWDRVNRLAHTIPFDGWAYDVLVSRAFHRVLAPSAIAVEVFIALGLWSARTRLAAIWVAIAFHGSIEIAASVQTFSYSAIAALLIWVTPSTRDRTVVAPSPGLRTTVRALDWLGRFEVEPNHPRAGGLPGPVLIDRDGSVRHGREARWVILSRLPALFVVAYPAFLVQRFGRGPRPEAAADS